MKVHYDIRFWIEDDESWHRAGSFEVDERVQKQSGSVAEALWHGKPRHRTDEHLGCVHRSIVGELCGLIAQRVCDLVRAKEKVWAAQMARGYPKTCGKCGSKIEVPGPCPTCEDKSYGDL